MSEGTRKAYISYSRRSDYSFIQTLLDVAGAENQLRSIVAKPHRDPAVCPLTQDEPENLDLDQWDLIYDENGLEAFGSIKGFMDEVSEGEQVITLLSKGYFQSPYCMTELLSIYHKQAENLVPIVVFVDGFKPSDLSIDEILAFWKKRREDLEKEEKDKEAKHAAQVHQYLRPALAWLLGGYDEKHGGWDTLFPVVDATEGGEGAARQVIQELSRERKPRYPYFSAKERRRQAKGEVEKILAKRSTKEWFELLARRFSPFPMSPEKFAGRLVEFESADEFSKILRQFIEWMEEDLDDLLADPTATQVRKNLVKDIKNIIGWLLLMIMDETRMNQLIHKLNRLGPDARQELNRESNLLFQAIASSLFGAAVRYTYNPSESPSLRGENQIDLIDQGPDKEQYRQYIKEESDWMNIKKSLFSKRISLDEYDPSSQEVDDAFRAELQLDKGTYLFVDDDTWGVKNCGSLLKMLGESFPELHQMIAVKDTEETPQAYLREGMKSGSIAVYILKIHKRLYELTQ